MAEFLIPSLFLLFIPSPPGGTLIHGADTVSVEFMLDELDTAQVVFVGENHDDPLAHEWELYLWSVLASQDRSLALEMFEADVQELLDRYLSGEALLEELLENSRPWGNYLEDYHPMVEYARQNGFSVIAANVPRYLASSVAMGGWDGLAGEPAADFFLSAGIDSSDTGYRERFLETMEMMGDQMHQMPMDPMDIYRAQLFKDAVMARSVNRIRSMFVCGSFHCDYGSGIPGQLQQEATFMTVRIVGDGEPWESEMADFLVLPPGDPAD